MAKIQMKRPEGNVLLVTDGDLYAEHSAIREELSDQVTNQIQDGRIAGGAKSLAQKLVDVERRMKEGSVTFRLRGMPRNEWQLLKAQFPPRADNELDVEFGANADEVCAIGVPKSIISATFHNGEEAEYDWDELTNEMTDSQWMDFVYMFMALNGGDAGVPFTHAASKIAQS